MVNVDVLFNKLVVISIGKSDYYSLFNLSPMLSILVTLCNDS